MSAASDNSSKDPVELEHLAAGRRLFLGPCDFMLGCVSVTQLPPDDLPEIAFAGRSNVGKSSLINALTGRRSLARTSNTPGRTQQINFFDLGGRMRIADMPGYGFAKAPKKAVEEWTRLIHDYLRGRVNLRRVCVLVDARHGLKANDESLMRELDASGVQFRVVLTKCDKPKKAELNKIADAVAAALKTHAAAAPDVLCTSSEKGDGIELLRAELAGLANGPELG